MFGIEGDAKKTLNTASGITALAGAGTWIAGVITKLFSKEEGDAFDTVGKTLETGGSIATGVGAMGLVLGSDMSDAAGITTMAGIGAGITGYNMFNLGKSDTTKAVGTGLMVGGGITALGGGIWGAAENGNIGNLLGGSSSGVSCSNNNGYGGQVGTYYGTGYTYTSYPTFNNYLSSPPGYYGY